MGAGSGISLIILIGYIKGYSKVEERTEEVGSYVSLYIYTLPCTSESYPTRVQPLPCKGGPSIKGLAGHARLRKRSKRGHMTSQVTSHMTSHVTGKGQAVILPPPIEKSLPLSSE